MRRCAVLVYLAMGACSDEAPDDSEGESAAVEGETVETAAESETPDRQTQPSAVEALPSVSAGPSHPPEDIELRTEDGVTVHATMHAAAVPEAPAVVLVHQLSSTRAEWGPLVERLTAAPGFAILTLDLRGHGESVVGAEGEALSYHAFDNDDWSAIEFDLKAGLTFVRQRFTPQAVALAGSSIGSSAAVRVAAADDEVSAVVALSPGRAYRGLDALTPFSTWGARPVLAIAAEGEAASAETARAMAGSSPSGVLRLAPGRSHGVGMFADDPGALEAVEQFLRRELRWSGGTPDR
ncbi:MAG: alpha/beta fold hydrolase [Myxococcota bacterium]